MSAKPLIVPFQTQLLKIILHLEQISETAVPDAILILRHYKPDLTTRLMELESINPKLRQDQIAKELGYLDSTLQYYRHDVKIPSTYKSNDPKRPQKTLNDPTRLEKTEHTKFCLKCGLYHYRHNE